MISVHLRATQYGKISVWKSRASDNESTVDTRSVSHDFHFNSSFLFVSVLSTETSCDLSFNVHNNALGSLGSTTHASPRFSRSRSKAGIFKIFMSSSKMMGIGIWMMPGRVAIIWTNTNIVLPKARSRRRAHFPSRVMTHFHRTTIKTRAAAIKLTERPTAICLHGWHEPVMLLK